MSRPLIVDTVMFHNEFDMLECRLDTMASAVDWFVVVEADVDHQNHPKPYYLSESLGRFDEWRSKLIVVRATDLPERAHQSEGEWTWEWAQRDWTWRGLEQIPDLSGSDIVLHGDVDEICHPLFVRNVRPGRREFVAFEQRWYSFAVDWAHPDPWGGTVAVTVDTARDCGERLVVDDYAIHPGAWQVVRNQRNHLMPTNFEHLGTGWRRTGFSESGWHFTWVGGRESAIAKLGSFCHPEVADRIEVGLRSDRFMYEGFHVDGQRLTPVDVDETWPAYIQQRRCPESWWRPR